MQVNRSDRERLLLALGQNQKTRIEMDNFDDSFETYDENTFPWTPKIGYADREELHCCNCRCQDDSIPVCYFDGNTADCLCSLCHHDLSCDACDWSLCCEVFLEGLLHGLCSAMLCGTL